MFFLISKWIIPCCHNLPFFYEINKNTRAFPYVNTAFADAFAHKKVKTQNAFTF